MRFLRAATEADGAELAVFKCAHPGSGFETDVETFIHTILDWRADPVGEGRTVLVLDEDDEITGVIAYEDDDDEVFINVVAVRLDRRRTAPGTGGRGWDLLWTVLDDLSHQGRHRGAWWKVHPKNLSSHALSSEIGAEAIYPVEDKPLAHYTLRF